LHPSEPDPRPRRLYVIHNPAAGWRRRQHYRQILAHLARRGCALTLMETAARGDAEALARAADPAAVDLVVAAGGDGTINEVINGLALSPLPLAILPLGTANLLAAEIGLVGSARAIAETIATRAPRPVFLGSANGRRFALMVGIGFDARVVADLDLGLKRALGRIAYALAALRQLLAYRARRYIVEIDGRPFAAAAVVIAKGHYYGGRFTIAPDARLDAPRLYVALFACPGRWNLMRYAWGLLSGRMDRLSDVRVVPASTVSVRAEPAGLAEPDAPGEAAQADGDLAATLPLAITLADATLALVTAA
jgi:YegS/Rv2252/BmrU family lipid kinase